MSDLIEIDCLCVYYCVIECEELISLLVLVCNFILMKAMFVSFESGTKRLELFLSFHFPDNTLCMCLFPVRKHQFIGARIYRPTKNTKKTTTHKHSHSTHTVDA
jgi:hypothetical protein